MVYKVAVHERASAAVTFSLFCAFALILITNKSKTLSYWELAIAGVSTFVIASVGALAVVNGISGRGLATGRRH